MIVVSTPTGNIGSKLVPLLLAAGKQVRVIARDPAKLAPDVRAAVDVVQGSADDPKVLDRALAHAHALFWVIPPNVTVADVTQYYLDFSRPAAAAAKAHGLRQVVSVSSLGRHLGRHAGVVSASHAKDALFEGSGVAFRGLWNPGFMENMLMQLQALKTQGAFYLPSKPDLKIPHAATRDIAASAAKLLCDSSWTGTGGLAVLGPEDLSPNQMAAIMTDVLGRPIHFHQVPSPDYRKSLMAHGLSAAMADALIEMYAAIDAGLYNQEPRTPENSTPTHFRTWCEEVLKPALSS